MLIFYGILTKDRRDTEMKKIVLALMILSITGCASTVVPPSKAISAPKKGFLNIK
jgi:hypothetical protein